MNYKKLLHTISRYSNILVTGPQRSGTTYFAKVLADDISYTHIDEMEFKAHNETKFLSLLQANKQVIQCPGMTHLLHKLPKSDLLIVFMLRNNVEIVSSEDRINWHPVNFEIEKQKYIAAFGAEKVQKYTRNATMKMDIWRKKQQKQLKNRLIEVPFSILSQTAGYVKNENRKNFKSKQIKC